MIQNKVDSTLVEKDIKEVLALLDTIRAKLPFLQAASPYERKHISKIGRKSQTFTVQALEMASRHPELMPGGLQLDAAQRDLSLFDALTPILQSISELHQQVEDTQMIAGSEAYAAARTAYKAARSFGDNAGMDGVIGEMGLRFRQSRQSSVDEA
jgi:hypothetical protein